MSQSIKGNKSSLVNVDAIVACAHCAGGGGSEIKGTMKRSRYSRAEEQVAPSKPPKVIFTPIPQRPQRDEIAAHGSFDADKIGHLVGKNIKFDEDRGKEVLDRLPEDQELGKEPSGPCAYEVSQFLVCASSRENLQDCEMIEEDLQDCKKKFNLPTRSPEQNKESSDL